MPNTTRYALENELKRQQAACDAAYDNIATARKAIKRCEKRIGEERASIKAQRLVIDGQRSNLAECRTRIKQIKALLRAERNA